MTRVFWVDVGYATFGIISYDDTIIAAAPIGRWMIGLQLENIKQWLLKKKAIVKEINERKDN
jgi:hypothetical protein